MSNLETTPHEEVCSAGLGSPAPRRLEILEPRQVPLGGPRAMTVRRTLPQRQRSMVGAWCFLDHYGPDDVSAGPGMQVPPHPHTGLQTVSWLFAGEILHRDSVGSVRTVLPGALNLMTAGHGISHSEQSPEPAHSRPPMLHGVQLWTALPASALGAAPAFEHHADLPVLRAPGVVVRVFLGQLPAQDHLGSGGLRSPATIFTPLLGAQIDLAPGAELTLTLDPTFEHAVLVDTPTAIRVDEAPLGWSELGFLAAGADQMTLRAAPDGPARLLLIGGEPFTEEIVMWWNFVGRSHEDVVQARAGWERQLSEPAPAAVTSGTRFGTVAGYDGPALPAPQLPGVRLAPRRNPS